MLSRFPSWVRFGLLLAVLAGTQTGCQSWKTPSFNMFPWSKKPSPDTIAGTKPPTNLPGAPASSGTSSLAQDTSKQSGPTSPATRNTPSPIPGAPATASPTNLAMGNSAMPNGSASATPSPGAAAANNGFTPGNYNVPQTRTPTGTLPPNASNQVANNPYGPNPYASNAYAASPNGSVPAGVSPAGGIPQGSMPTNGLPNYGTPAGLNPAATPRTASAANPYGSTAPASAMYNAAPGQANIGYPAGMPSGNVGAMPPMQGNIPNLPAAYGGPGLAQPPAGLQPQGFAPQGLPQQGLPSQGLPSLPPTPVSGQSTYTPAGALPPGSVNPSLLPPGQAASAMPTGGSYPSSTGPQMLPPGSVSPSLAPQGTWPAASLPPGIPSAAGNASTATQPPAYTPAGPTTYRPGSIGRTTSYDFSGQNQVR